MKRRRQKAFLAAAFAALGACASAPDAGAPLVAAEAAPTAPAFVQGDLMGRDAAALDALLGAPALVRREGEGEFRRYALARCALIVILYPDESGRRAAGFLDAAAKTSGEEKPDLDGCLAGGAGA